MLAVRVFYGQGFKDAIDSLAFKVKMKNVLVVLFLITSLRICLIAILSRTIRDILFGLLCGCQLLVDHSIKIRLCF